MLPEKLRGGKVLAHGHRFELKSATLPGVSRRKFI
jgi:hypothetical protein